MQQNTMHSAKFLRKRKFLLALPLLVFPFLTLLFWALGGGKEATAQQAQHAKEGFNMELPAPVLRNDSSWNKMNFYQQADADSARIRKLMKADPYYSLPLAVVDSSLKSGEHTMHLPPAHKSPYSYSAGMDSREQKVYQQLAELDRHLAGGSTTSKKSSSGEPAFEKDHHSSITHDVAKLDKMMRAMQAPAPVDPELEQLQGMMETLRDIQHPELVQQKLKDQSEQQKGKVFGVNVAANHTPITMLVDEHQMDTLQDDAYTSAFYGMERPVINQELEKPAIMASIPESQTITAGSTVKLRLSQDIFINGVRINAGQFVYGLAQLSQERLTIAITSIRYNNLILPVSLAVYDLDGIEGVYIPGSITREVSKQSADQPLQSLNMLSLHPSLGAQAASSGLDIAKKIVSRKVKQAKVTITAGYQVLLKDTK